MKLQVSTFTEYRTLYREDLLFPAELGEFGVAPGLSSCIGHGCTSTSCCCCASVKPVPAAAA
jgi:hypothetical protein